MAVVESEPTTLLRALRERRSVPLMRDERPPRDLIEQVLDAASWAPNHHRTEPWRFVVLTGEALGQMGDLMADLKAASLPDPTSEEGQRQIEKARAKPLRAPVIVAVAAVPTFHPKAREIEEVEATAAAVQNMLLAAQDLGLGAMWRTGEPAYAAETREFLGLPDGAHIVGFIYLGYPAVPAVPREGRSARRHTTWRGWD